MVPPKTANSDKEGEEAIDPTKRHEAPPPQQGDGTGSPPNPMEQEASNGSNLNGSSSKDPHDEPLNNQSDEGLGSSQNPPPQNVDGSGTNQQQFGTNTTASPSNPHQSSADGAGNGSYKTSNPPTSQNPPKVNLPAQGSDTGTNTESNPHSVSSDSAGNGPDTHSVPPTSQNPPKVDPPAQGSDTGSNSEESRGNQSKEGGSTREQDSSTRPTQKAPSADGTSSNPPTQTTSSGTRTNGNDPSQINGGSNRQGASNNPPSHANAGSGHYVPQRGLYGQGPTNTSYLPSTNFVGLGPEGSQGAGYGNHWNPSGYDYYAPPPPMNNFYGHQAGAQLMNGMNWQHPQQQGFVPGWSRFPSQPQDYGSWSYQGHRRVLEQVYSEQTDPYGVLWKTVRFQNEPNIVSITASELLQIQRQNEEITNQNSDPLPPGNNPQQAVGGVSTVGPVPPVHPYAQAPQNVSNIAPVRPQSSTNGPILPTVKREPRAPPKRTVFSPPRNRGRSKSRRSRSRTGRNKNDVSKIEKKTVEKRTKSPSKKNTNKNSAPKASTSGATSSNQNPQKKTPQATQSSSKCAQPSKKNPPAKNSTNGKMFEKPPAAQKKSMNQTFTAKEKTKKPAPRSSSQVRTQPPAPKKPSTFTHDQLLDLLLTTLDKKIESFNALISTNGQDVVKQKAVLAKLIRLRTHAAQIQKESKTSGPINEELREQSEEVRCLLASAPSYALNEYKRIEESLLLLRRRYVESLLVDNKGKCHDKESTLTNKKWFIEEVNKELMIQLKAVKENRFSHVLLLPLYPPKVEKKEETKEEEEGQNDEKSGGPEDDEEKKDEDGKPKNKCSHLSCASSDTCLSKQYLQSYIN